MIITLRSGRLFQKFLMLWKGESALHVVVVVGTLKAFRNRGLEVGHGSCSCFICTVGWEWLTGKYRRLPEADTPAAAVDHVSDVAAQNSLHRWRHAL